MVGRRTPRRAGAAEARFGRGWYNLGLAYAGMERLPEALRALGEACRLMARSVDPSCAVAAVHLRMGDTGSARAALEECSKIDPAYTPAREALRKQRPRRAGRSRRRAGGRVQALTATAL